MNNYAHCVIIIYKSCFILAITIIEIFVRIVMVNGETILIKKKLKNNYCCNYNHIKINPFQVDKFCYELKIKYKQIRILI